jgi:hypothetical protein
MLPSLPTYQQEVLSFVQRLTATVLLIASPALACTPARTIEAPKAPPPAQMNVAEPIPPPQLRTLPVGVELVGEASAPTTTLSLRDALAVRQRVARARGSPSTGGEQWWFRAFDRDTLVFVTCAVAPPPDAFAKMTPTCKVTQRIVVERAPVSTVALSVHDTIAPYERAVCGLLVGTHATSVQLDGRLGRVAAVTYPAAAGCQQREYSAAFVELCDGIVAKVTEKPGRSCGP